MIFFTKKIGNSKELTPDSGVEVQLVTEYSNQEESEIKYVQGIFER